MIEPFKHRVLIERDAPKTEFMDGVVIPEAFQKKEVTGVVLAVGAGADETLQVGQKVLFGYHDGTEVAPQYCDGIENCWLIADNQVRCILNA